MRLRAETHDELAVISDGLHDAWLNADKIYFDSVSGELTIPFELQVIVGLQGNGEPRLFERVRRRSVLCFLRVHHVTRFAMQDTEQVGAYDLTDIRYDERRNELKVRTGVPLRLTIEVRKLSVDFEETDRVLDEREGLRLQFELLSRPSKAFMES